MISSVWRRLRGLAGKQPQTGYLPKLPHTTGEPPNEPETSGATPHQTRQAEVAHPRSAGVSSTSLRAGSPAPTGPSKSIDELAQTFSASLTVAGVPGEGLEDDHLKPLLLWARKRLQDLAKTFSALPPETGVPSFRRGGDQLLELLRLIRLAVAERTDVDPDLLVSRLQMVDTLLDSPLFDERASGVARARLDALVQADPKRLQSQDPRELIRRLLEVLG